ncbi:methyltransferase domain-containing protein [Pseudobacteriovorax antillogorgiicola]|uniref:Thiopurine S-methyltransferase n=1 Tax=Pseudobacteriovorax antillogorgiicola TaxID=1513793 RepID=A0A1Y6C4Q5_9BACT|nr:methyltransferase domain-containing protein [Pseudobacteriovorax antillogorgiicola]TCS50310.1 thiopurine S-methyltransferase [Pseudobacteriovorax antillogorgiicola]SMF34086.1 thiopurine S-methyltransferase [Pseudobacteriovorax antillogorgiicola]
MEQKEPWQERWRSGRTGWDHGDAHPALFEIMAIASREGGLSKAARVVVPGCGRGHEAAALAESGYTVTALDFVDEAIQQALSLYEHVPGLTFKAQDFFLEEPDQYDALVDRAMLCALQPDHRHEYVAKVSEILKPEGLFLGILFAEQDPPRDEGPPFMLNEAQIEALFGSGFDLVSWESQPNRATPSIITREWLCVWRKKS